MNKFIEASIESFASLVQDAVVFVDLRVAECLHWSNGFARLLESKALSIKEITYNKECLESETKAVFAISTPLQGQVAKLIQRIILNSDFEQCILVSTVSNDVNEFCGGGFSKFENQMKVWMGKEFAAVSIHHIPLFSASLMKDIFMTVAHNNLFPVLPSDVARLQAFLHSQGDKRVFNHLGEVDFGFLPRNIQTQVKMLSSSLNSMFTSLNTWEDCYAVGHFSKLLATELANTPEARARRRNAAHRSSVVFIDRTLDLVGPMSHQCNVLDTIYEVLPRLKHHNNDVAVNLHKLFAANENITDAALASGCLSHSGQSDSCAVLEKLIMQNKKKCISFICGCLRDILKAEDCEAFTMSSVEKLLLKFKGRLDLFLQHANILQPCMAFLNAFTDPEIDHIDEILSAQKVMMLGDAEGNPFSQILALLTKKDSRFSVIDALTFCLLVYSADKTDADTTYGEEEKLKEALIHILMDGDHKEDVLFLLGDLDSSERQIRTRLADIFERLRGIRQARNELKTFKSLLYDDLPSMQYKPIVQQVLEEVLQSARQESTDVEFCSHGFRDFLKTGFGFFMNVNKPWPTDHPTLFIFVVGGITWNEVKCMRETIEKLQPKQKVIIGSTKILTPSDALEQVLCSENLFVDVDT